MVALGDVQIKVSGQHLAGARSSASIDLFVRPERLSIGDPGGPGTLAGEITGLTYHGGHIDLQIASSTGGDGLLLVRVAGDQAMMQWPPGTRVGISIDADGCVAFPAA